MFYIKLKTYVNLIFLSLFSMNYCLAQDLDANLLNEFVSYGNKAPSSHNAKMWDVRINSEEKSIILGIDEEKTLPAIDSNNREAWISLGAFCQNIKLIAKDYGYNANILKIDNTVKIYFDLIDTVSMRNNTYAKLINNRHTLRKGFKKDAIDSLIYPIQQKHSELIYLKNGSYLFDELVSQSKEANYQQINSSDRRMELAFWINFEKDRASGINLKNLGLNFFERQFFRCFVREKYFYDSKLIRENYVTKTNSLYDKGAGFLLITSQGNNEYSWFNSGILLEEVWIQLTALYINVQPMSQIIEEEPYYSQLKKILNINGEIQMVLRIGKI